MFVYKHSEATDYVEVATTGMRYFERSRFFGSSVSEKYFGFI